MSKAVEVLYGVFFDEMKFAKRQQWTVTNYMLLLLGAMLGASVTLKPLTSFEKHAIDFLVLGIVGAAWYFLIDLQCYLKKLRERIQRIEATFDADDKALVQVESYTSPGRRGLPFTIMMIAAITVAGVVVMYVVWRL
jgi:hypothetical protein